MIERLRSRQEWQFFRALRRAAPAYAIGWWILVVLRGTLPAVTLVAFNATPDRPGVVAVAVGVVVEPPH